MRKILQYLFNYTSPEPLEIFARRTHLQLRQKQNIKAAQSLPSKPQLLSLSLQQLSKMKGEQKMGTFISRCAYPYHQQLKFLADMNITKAYQINKQGIPFTVKDHLKVSDMVSTCGYSNNIVPQYENSDVVDLLIKEGCVPFAHTNIPQGLLNIQSGNLVYGISVNPYNKKFISGGSSGGEAVSVATRCSAFGLASDSAGSSRIPAAYCGVVGFKPTGSVRLSRKGRLGASGQQTYIFKDLDVSMGFISRNVEDLKWLCSRTLGKSPSYNPYILGEWDEQKYQELKKKKLRFGYMIQDKQMKAVPAIKNAILESAQLLRKNGHEVKQFNFDDLYKFRDFTFKILNITGAIRGISRFLKGEHQTRQTWWIHQRSQFGRLGSIIRQSISTSQAQRNVYKAYNVGNTLQDYVRACQHKNLIKATFLKAWKDSGIDILITPVTPFTAPIKNSDQFLLHQLTFCAFPNILEMPSGTIPIRLVKREETNYNQTGFYESRISNSIKQSEGLPVGIQLTAAHMEDQLCIAGMWQLEQLLERIPAPKEKEE